MYKKEFCKQLECDIYYKPSNDVLEYADNKNDALYRIRDLYNSKYKNALRSTFTYKISNVTSKKYVEEYINLNYTNDDITIYTDIKNIINEIPIEESNRGQYRINSIKKYVQNIDDFHPTSYLDIGCFQGDITVPIGKYFNLDKFQIHGIDIKKYHTLFNDEFIFALYDGKKISYNDNNFDLITCFMVLHHVPLENIDSLISEINRVTKPGGILILREHNADIKDIQHINLLNILHEYYDFVLNPTQSWAESTAYYNSEKHWSSKLLKSGFIRHTIPDIGRNNPKNPYNNYICSFKKKQ